MKKLKGSFRVRYGRQLYEQQAQRVRKPHRNVRWGSWGIIGDIAPIDLAIVVKADVVIIWVVVARPTVVKCVKLHCNGLLDAIIPKSSTIAAGRTGQRVDCKGNTICSATISTGAGHLESIKSRAKSEKQLTWMNVTKPSGLSAGSLRKCKQT